MKYVRVKGPDGSEYTASATHAQNAGLKVIDKPALDEFGRALPAKPGTDKAGMPVATKTAAAVKEA